MTDGVVETPQRRALHRMRLPTTRATKRSSGSTRPSAKSDEAWDAFRAKYLDVSEDEYQAAVHEPPKVRVVRHAGRGVLRSRWRRCFRGDGEILANPIGTIPTIGGRLAKATFEPALVMTDGEALLVENILPVGVDDARKVVAGWNPYRTMFDVVWSGRRHMIMGGSQIDTFGNQNFAFIGLAREADRATARHARRARQHDQQQDVATGSRTTRRECSCREVDVVSRRRLRPRRRRSAPRPRASTELRPRRDATSACSTSRRPTTGCGCGRCTPA